MLDLVAKKIGMTHLYLDNGTSVPLTMLKVYDNCVVSLTQNEDKDFNNILVGYNKVENSKRVSKPVAGVFLKNKLPIHKSIYGCKVDKDQEYKAGDIIDFSEIFKIGDKIDVAGTSSGKGFAGAMKRHNFGGLEASHGISISHRSHGSTGQCQDPGKVFKGKKMAGHMGAERVTTSNLEVMIVDKEKGLLGIKGCVAGRKGNDVILKLSRK